MFNKDIYIQGLSSQDITNLGPLVSIRDYHKVNTYRCLRLLGETPDYEKVLSKFELDAYKKYGSINLDELITKTEGIHTCSKCNSKSCVSVDRQTRSADEGCTTFVTCLSCKHEWHFAN